MLFWCKNAFPSVESGSTGTFDKLAEQNLIGLKKVLDANDDSGIEAVRKLMDFYQSCMNTEEINTLGAEPILAVIKSTGD
jgi:predicted metalloendopeptidase